MALLQVENLSVAFGGRALAKKVVRGVSLEIEPGQITGIVGESGCGKTTLMRALTGLLPGDARVECDRILIAGEDITPPSGEQRYLSRGYQNKMEKIRGKQMAMIFQEPSLYLDDAVTIGKQMIDTVREHQKCTKKEAARRAEELLDLVGMPAPKVQMKKYSFELSGGMCQRAAIAVALACEPKLVIADEPTTALDVLVQGQILELLRRIVQETGTAILLVSHDLGVIASTCDRVLVMQGGRIVESGEVQDVFYLPEHPYTERLLALARKTSAPMGANTAGAQSSPILEIHHVSREFGKLEAVRDVSLQIREGEIFGLVGESGCGKTTLAKMAAGLLKPGEGEILYKKKPIVVPGRWKKSGPGEIQMVFQNPAFALSPMLTVREQMEDAMLASGAAAGEECAAKIREMLELVGLAESDAEKYPREFSGGQKQRLVIARALLLNPKLIVCDEPVSSLDASIREQILELLVRIRDRSELTCLLISHDLSVIKDKSQRVGVMYQGCLVEMGPTSRVVKEPWHPYTKALLGAALEPDTFRARRKKPAVWLGEKEKGKKDQCPFAGQCSYATERCRHQKPELYSFGERMAACFLYSDETREKHRAGYVMRSQI